MDTTKTNARAERKNEARHHNEVQNRLYQSPGDKALMVLIYTLLTLLTVAILYPLLFVVGASLSAPDQLLSGNVWLWPVGFSVQAYKTIAENGAVITGFGNSLIYASLGTLMSMTLTVLAAYPLSRKEMIGRNFFTFIFTFIMLFNGGLIPTYLVIRDLGLIDTRLIMILLGGFSTWYLVITRTYIQTSIPDDLYEASTLDGCDYITFLVRIVIPLSTPILAVLLLMYAVGYWNSYFNALIYLNTPAYYPLQLVLRNILIENTIDPAMMTAGNAKDDVQRRYLVEVLKYALIVFSSLPVLILYPFIQKYFIRGIMVGSIKG